MKAFIVIQSIKAGQNLYAVLAKSEDDAIREVDRVYGIRCASYSVRESTGELAIYVASNVKPKKVS